MEQISKTQDIKDRVHTKILNFLSYKLRSETEVSDKLEQYLRRYKSISRSDKKDIREGIVKNLKKVNLLNDDTFTSAFVNEKIKSPKAVSKWQIKRFLIKKGVHEKVIENALKAYSKEVEVDKITQDARKKFSSLRKLDKLQQKKRLYNYLGRKGYPYDKIRSVVDSMCNVK